MEIAESDTSKRVRAALAEHDVSAAALARRLGRSQSYLARRLRGRVPWRADDLASIARELGVNTTVLLGEPELAR